jgi:hypothetical protein
MLALRLILLLPILLFFAVSCSRTRPFAEAIPTGPRSGATGTSEIAKGQLFEKVDAFVLGGSGDASGTDDGCTALNTFQPGFAGALTEHLRKLLPAVPIEDDRHSEEKDRRLTQIYSCMLKRLEESGGEGLDSLINLYGSGELDGAWSEWCSDSICSFGLLATERVSASSLEARDKELLLRRIQGASELGRAIQERSWREAGRS